ncbi:DUF1294 domain-containing protein [Flavobacterium sp. TAB 87]|uniref:DUF1294 domain-containing protein n=1 Tax=Flavobacterium sp. TAB 87 TaxID=1729581 RepID=UPI00076BC787|nr:DUF1294 domain-containing protein [Flavobacterium sp. TAB 87]KVV13468.1 hypothetical protein AP058_02832 [Flavobacterium sp. TAB 87]
MILFYSFLLLNLIAFVLMGYDKNAAKTRRSRIPEQALLTFVLLGGTIGSGLGMLVFRHKTSKKSYLWKFWIIVVIQIVIAVVYFK